MSENTTLNTSERTAPSIDQIQPSYHAGVTLEHQPLDRVRRQQQPSAIPTPTGLACSLPARHQTLRRPPIRSANQTAAVATNESRSSNLGRDSHTTEGPQSRKRWLSKPLRHRKQEAIGFEAQFVRAEFFFHRTTSTPTKWASSASR